MSHVVLHEIAGDPQWPVECIAGLAMISGTRKLLIHCGLVSSFVYVAADVAGILRWPGYDPFSQTISELSAIDAPSRSVWAPLGVLYDVLLVAFGYGLWTDPSKRRRLRRAAATLILVGLIGLVWPPMHLRGTVLTLTDTLHVVWASLTSLLILLAIAFGMNAFGLRFRAYSSATILLLVIFGSSSFFYGPKIAANLPTPGAGFVERVDLLAYLVWVAVLSLTVTREQLRMPSDESLPLAGDGILPTARAQATHRIDIAAPASDVWPWLLQMGRSRGGWYSWDLLDNGGRRSATRVVPELQKLDVGDRLPMRPDDPEGVAVLALEPARALVLGTPSLLEDAPRSESQAEPSTAPRATWTFALRPIDRTHTRLLVRVRADYRPGLVATLVRPLVVVAHDVMERKQLRTIKKRVERAHAASA